MKRIASMLPAKLLALLLALQEDGSLVISDSAGTMYLHIMP